MWLAQSAQQQFGAGASVQPGPKNRRMRSRRVSGPEAPWRRQGKRSWLLRSPNAPQIGHARALAASASSLPVVAADFKDLHYVYPGSILEPNQFALWVDGVIGAALPPTVRSAPPPLTNFGPVITVVAATMQAPEIGARVV